MWRGLLYLVRRRSTSLQALHIYVLTPVYLLLLSRFGGGSSTLTVGKHIAHIALGIDRFGACEGVWLSNHEAQQSNGPYGGCRIQRSVASATLMFVVVAQASASIAVLRRRRLDKHAGQHQRHEKHTGDK